GAEAAEAMSGLARVLLCRGASVACLPLVSLFGRDCEADNGCSGADGPRQKRGACRGHASVDARDDRQRQILRGASGLLGADRGRGRGGSKVRAPFCLLTGRPTTRYKPRNVKRVAVGNAIRRTSLWPFSMLGSESSILPPNALDNGA